MSNSEDLSSGASRTTKRQPKRQIWSSQGVHRDPLVTPIGDMAGWSRDQQEAWTSAELEVFRSELRYGSLDVRDAVLDELASYYGYTVEECKQRCLHWEEWSVEEWRDADRSTREGVTAFYQTVQSWSFDLMWYAYLQATGHNYPASVVAARFALSKVAGRDHLDFGSGSGTTAQLFLRLGFRSTLADISKPLLDFAGWRLERRGETATRLDLNHASLPEASYDIITALDTLVHVTDFDLTVAQLHRALRKDGYLLANFDIRAKDDHGSMWHLHNDFFSLDHRLRKAGFVYSGSLGGVTRCYRRVDPSEAMFGLKMGLDRNMLPVKRASTYLRRVSWPIRDRMKRGLKRILGSA